jgi:hypothetical protein
MTRKVSFMFDVQKSAICFVKSKVMRAHLAVKLLIISRGFTQKETHYTAHRIRPLAAFHQQILNAAQ